MLWRFRNKPEVQALQCLFLDEVNQQLSEKGLYIKSGEISIVDASVIKARRNRPNKGVNGENTQDPDAAYNVKAGADGKKKSTYDFKAHINVDVDGFIKSTDVTAGNVHDSRCFTDLLSGAEAQVYADNAYASEKPDEWLAEREIENRVLERAYRNKLLTLTQKSNNHVKSRIRSNVGRVFGVLKQHQGMGQARYLGNTRNRMRFNLQCVAYNIKPGVNLQKEICGIQESYA